MGELDLLWSSRYEKRNLWRDRAMDSYINSLSDTELKEFIRNSMRGTVPVSLYGNAQVGKTTFLLELMGIKRECLDTIHGILRCGTIEGTSATPTAMIYKRTPRNEFRIHYQSEVLICPNEETIRNELTSLREKIEDGSFQYRDEIVIEIPERYFEMNPEIDIQICDLPGVESSNEKERPHVEQIIKKFVPLSALILVFQVGSEINSVSDLFNNSMMSEHYGWKYMTKRYRLIITKAYTADSVIRDVKFEDPFTGKKNIVEHYRREANRDANNPENVPEDIKVFPFELGKSFRDIPNKYKGDENRQTVIHSILDELWSEIHADIKQTAESGNIVQRLSELSHIVEKLVVDKQDEKSELESKFKKMIAAKEIEYTDFSSNNEINDNIIKDIDIEIKRLSEIGTIKEFNHYNGGKIKGDMIKFIETSVATFMTKVNRVNQLILIDNKELWNYQTHQLFSEIKGKIKNIRYNKAGELFFGALRWGPEESHIIELNDRVSELNTRINDIYNEYIKSLIKIKINEFKKEKKEIQNRIFQNNDRLQILQNEINNLCSERDNKIGELSQKIESYESELRNEKSFANIMSTEIQKEKNLAMANLGDKPPVEAFLDLMYTALIIKEYDKQIKYS